MGRFDTTYDPNSPTESWKRERSQLNFAMFPDQAIGPQNANPSCPDCKQKYIVVDGGQNYFCKWCGERRPIKETKQEKRLIQKHGSTKLTGSILTSQKPNIKTKGIDVNRVDEDIKRDLEGFGYSPE